MPSEKFQLSRFPTRSSRKRASTYAYVALKYSNGGFSLAKIYKYSFAFGLTSIDMLPDNPLLQLTPARAMATRERLQKGIWQSNQSLSVEFAGSSCEHVDLKTARQRPRKKVEGPFFWGALEDQAWFRITIPDTCHDGSWYLQWKEQGESTAYIDGHPYAGLDVGHHECPIPEGCREIWMEVMALESGIWVPFSAGRPGLTDEGCRFEAARACQRDDLAWEVYHSFDVLCDLLESEFTRNSSLRTPFQRQAGHLSPLEDVTPLYRRLARQVENAICAYETGGLSACRETLDRIYEQLKGQSEQLRCRLTGHAHIDLVWLWTEKASQFKAVHTFATANRLMERYPEFRFGYSQPASYRAVEARAPELMRTVRERIQSGRWEAVGAAEVESDTMMACGEALARSLIIGQEGFRDLQGSPSPVLWLPDVFGYSACLPQIMKQTGVDYFFTTKLHWGSVTLFPYSSFIWQGSDGTEILSHVSQGMGYNMNVKPSEIRAAANEYRQADVHDEMLMACGYGDGGGGVTESMCERARRLSDLAGTPKSAWGRIDEYFQELETVRSDLPAYKGELYLQYHRGVLTTHGDLKAAFRAAERALQTWEAAHCATASGPIDPEAWRRVVFAQFHDYIPGSSIPEVYEEALPELGQIAETAKHRGLEALRQEREAAALFNPLPLARQVLHGGRLLEIQPLCGRSIDTLKNLDPEAVAATESELKNGRVHACFDENGSVTALCVNGRSVAIAQPLARLVSYPDQPHAFEAWDIDRSTLAQAHAPKKARVLGATSDGATGQIEFEIEITAQSRAVATYTLKAGSPVLELSYRIDWQDTERLLKVLFATEYSGSHARFGDPFGSTLRSQQPGKPYDEAQWEVAGNRWAMVADDGEQEGLFVVTEAKYGWSCRSGTLGLSLLRSARLPEHPNKVAAPPRTRERAYSDLGSHEIRLAFGRFDPDAPREETPAAWADLLYTPPLAYHGPAVDCGFHGIEGGHSLLPCWARPESERSWTLRLHETLGRRGSFQLKLSSGYEASPIRLDGSALDCEASPTGWEYRPYEVLSFRIVKT